VDIHNPIGGGEKDPYEEYQKQLQAREREKKEGETRSSLTETPLIAQILFWMKKTIYRLIGVQDASPNLAQALIELKNHMEILKIEDRSSDLPFFNELASSWKSLLEEQRIRKNKEISHFIKQIQSYPNNEEHSLGYYLSENLAKHWIPAPYCQIIEKLHIDHLNEPKQSILVQWTDELNQILVIGC
jgi:hypothetical protein